MPDEPRTRVDFYVLPEEGEQAVGRFVCRLVEKAWRSGHSVYVHAPDDGAVARLDRLMWSYRQDSFLPHEPYRAAATEPAAPVLIGSGPAGPAHAPEVLVNTGLDLPPLPGRCPRVAEIVAADPEGRAAGRERYRHYRRQDVDLHFHEL
ncbi:MAG: DNA polymerase III subunit chi [Gammaproteobacteria bacterium]|nr:DNA polymerase III subunit chi [Gammaproteobacteria bacterium]